jgi:hypothetical protein
MSDWSDRALAKLEQRSKSKQHRDEVWLEEQRIKKAQAVPIWHDIRSIVQKHVADFNHKSKSEQLFFEVTQNTELRVRSEIEDHHRFLAATFDEATARLTYRCGIKHGVWHLTIVDGKVAFHWDNMPVTPDSIAEQMLDALMEGD